DPNAGSGIELQVIAAVVIGGTSLMGGRGSVISTFFGVLIISVPFLISPAAASVGEPLTCSTPPLLVGTPFSFRCATSDCAIARPMPSLSNET
ncbi:hypothetical protein ACRXB1_26760, partial [Caballeronia sp. M23-90]